MTNNRLQELADCAGRAVKSIVDAIVRIVKEAWRRIKHIYQLQVEVRIKLVKTYEKNVARHKHNQYTRSTWRVDWNTRKGNQWMNHKPVFAVRKILR